MTSRVFLPIEPVEPRIETPFTPSFCKATDIFISSLQEPCRIFKTGFVHQKFFPWLSPECRFKRSSASYKNTSEELLPEYYLQDLTLRPFLAKWLLNL